MLPCLAWLAHGVGRNHPGGDFNQPRAALGRTTDASEPSVARDEGYTSLTPCRNKCSTCAGRKRTARVAVHGAINSSSRPRGPAGLRAQSPAAPEPLVRLFINPQGSPWVSERPEAGGFRLPTLPAGAGSHPLERLPCAVWNERHRDLCRCPHRDQQGERAFPVMLSGPLYFRISAWRQPGASCRLRAHAPRGA